MYSESPMLGFFEIVSGLLSKRKAKKSAKKEAKRMQSEIEKQEKEAVANELQAIDSQKQRLQQTLRVSKTENQLLSEELSAKISDFQKKENLVKIAVGIITCVSVYKIYKNKMEK